MGEESGTGESAASARSLFSDDLERLSNVGGDRSSSSGGGRKLEEAVEGAGFSRKSLASWRERREG